MDIERLEKDLDSKKASLERSDTINSIIDYEISKILKTIYVSCESTLNKSNVESIKEDLVQLMSFIEELHNTRSKNAIERSSAIRTINEILELIEEDRF
jgi:hypothetical protein